MRPREIHLNSPSSHTEAFAPLCGSRGEALYGWYPVDAFRNLTRARRVDFFEVGGKERWCPCCVAIYYATTKVPGL